MKVGIISDTHDDIENVQEAIQIFNKNKVDYVIHAGDYVFPGIVREFKNLNAKFIGVLGNNDGEKDGISKTFMEINGELKGDLGEIEIDGIRFGIYHGTNSRIKQTIYLSQIYDILVCGHTHKKEPKESGAIKSNKESFILNPGSAHRKSASISGSFEEMGQIMLFNTENKTYEFISLSI
jgi:putative phosphoesterase